MAIGYQQAVNALRGGDRLMVTHPDPSKASEKTVYALVRSGRTVSLPAYRKLVDNLAPVPDGLFGTDMSQTFEWRGNDAP